MAQLVRPLTLFGSGHDLKVARVSPALDSQLSIEPTSDSDFPSLFAPPHSLHVHVFSLFKKKIICLVISLITFRTKLKLFIVAYRTLSDLILA